MPKNPIEVLAQARRNCCMVGYFCDNPAYLATRRALDAIWHERIGTPYLAMSMIVVANLLNNPGKTDLQAPLPYCLRRGWFEIGSLKSRPGVEGPTARRLN